VPRHVGERHLLCGRPPCGGLAQGFKGRGTVGEAPWVGFGFWLRTDGDLGVGVAVALVFEVVAGWVRFWRRVGGMLLVGGLGGGGLLPEEFGVCYHDGT